ncbi:MAG: phytanoyl-CoA dioxygenase family protein [Candidatus Latescibacterota bacterium]|nr:phytanoyl-CoA dioxygenase family protein [Candidatus Latescibacterota bacterium]
MPEHPTFTPDQREQALAFFRNHHYVVVSDALLSHNMQVLRDFVDHSEKEIASEWGPDRLGCRSHAQILVRHAELDEHVRPTVAWELVDEIMGPDTRFAQFDFRDLWPDSPSEGPMRWHKDRQHISRAGEDPNPHYNCTYVCAIHYLTDVQADSPCFGLVSNSHEYASLDEAREQMGDDFSIIPIRGPAGTLVLYNIAILHSRIDGVGRRLTQHNYFSRGQSAPLTNWVMVPQRLTEHNDPEVRAFFGQWSDATRAFAESGYSDQYYVDHVMEKLT